MGNTHHRGVDAVDEFYIGGVQVTSTAAELNALDDITATVGELNLNDQEYQLLVADGPITVKNGICKIAKTAAGVVSATLANPTTGTDDYKRLTIINFQAQANNITVTGGFGDGGAGEDVATFSATIGDTLALIAHGGFWYIIGSHQCTLA